jgi:hypothetical protein
MSRNSSKTGRQDRSTIYGVFLIFALLPTAFSVAFEHTPRGIASVQPWLMVVFPVVLLIAARFIPPMWDRSPVVAMSLVMVAAGAAIGFCWRTFDLLGFIGLTGTVQWMASAVVASAYFLFGLVMGHLRARTSTRHDNGLHPSRSGSAPAVVRERVRH